MFVVWGHEQFKIIVLLDFLLACCLLLLLVLVAPAGGRGRGRGGGA